MANNANDTMTEGLKKLLGQLGQLMVLPDADPQFLTGLQMGISDFLKGQYDVNAVAQSQNQGQAPQQLMGQLGQQMGMAAPTSPPPMTGGANGMAGISGGMPNPDELRRLLTQGGGVQ